MNRQRRLAVNPIPYWITRGRTRETLEEAFVDLADIGFTAVKADVPDGMTPAEYLRWIDGYGFAASVSLFNSPLDDTVDVDAEVERARRFGAVQAEVGLDRTMISSMSVPARLTRPAVGAGFDSGRFERAVDMAARICDALLVEGVHPLLHSHVGGVIETEAEITGLLDALGEARLGFGPDTGHLRWAGIDPAGIIGRYADRVGAIHIKDVFPDHLDGSRRGALGYDETVATRRLWAEPGAGVLDFAAIVRALPAGYDGDFMIEIDHPSIESIPESHRIAYAWSVANLPVEPA